MAITNSRVRMSWLMRLLFGRSSLWSDCTSENSSVVRGMSHFRVEEKQNERLTIFSPDTRDRAYILW